MFGQHKTKTDLSYEALLDTWLYWNTDKYGKEMSSLDF